MSFKDVNSWKRVEYLDIGYKIYCYNRFITVNFIAVDFPVQVNKDNLKW